MEKLNNHKPTLHLSTQKMKKTVLILLPLAVLLLASCGGGSSDKKAQLEGKKKELAKLQAEISALEKSMQGEGGSVVSRVVDVKVIPLKPSKFRHYIKAMGKVDSDQNVLVSPKVPSTITQVFVTEGQTVSKGQVLFQLDDQVYIQSRAELETAIELAETVYKKQQNLWNQKIGTEIQYLTAKNNYESLKNKLATLGDQIDMYKVKAPFNGTIDEVFGKVGESGMPGMPVVRIINYAKTKIVADISDTYYSKVKVGDPVEVSFPDLEQKFTSRVKSKGQVINNVNRTFTVEIEAGSMSGTIRPNMIAEVFINDYTANMAKVVPLNFVQTDLKGDFVFTVGEEKGKSVAKRSLIEKGLYYGDSVEIKNGLNFDDQVISTGYLNVTEGQILNIK